MKPKQKLFFWVVVLCQLLVLGGMIVKRQHLLDTGQLVRLKCEPIDPRSLFSGDYVILNYTISTFSKDEWERLVKSPVKLRKNDTVYVALEKEKESPYWVAAAISPSLETLQQNHNVVIRGVLQNHWRKRIRYGVEHYFVPQFEGLDIEKQLAQVSVEVALSDSGESGITRLFIEGQEVQFY